ncbi:MAG: hypothetical protein KC493_14380 [Bacteriovoracaceae bacterium]|nr:hypothetical protein [Bacteriovoracaceae bacterium]
MTKFIGLITMLTIMAFWSASQASEVDSFHKRYTPISDSLEPMNKKTNEFLEDALNMANEKDKGCSKKVLYKSMRKFFRNHYFGKLNPWLLESDEIDKIVVGVKDSIYRDFKWYQALVPGLLGRINDPSGKLVKMGEFMVGTDKFEHFLGSGYMYFNKYYLKNKDLKDAFMIGWKSETGYMGAMTTGVMAYADMVANFNGMRFWNHVLAENEDVMGSEEKYNHGPYVACDNNKWVKVKDIDWIKYIDHAWDEGINCSKFRTKKMTKSVKKYIRTLELKEERRFTCPIYPKKLEVVTKKYTKFLKWLINNEGHKSIK